MTQGCVMDVIFDTRTLEVIHRCDFDTLELGARHLSLNKQELSRVHCDYCDVRRFIILSHQISTRKSNHKNHAFMC